LDKIIEYLGTTNHKVVVANKKYFNHMANNLRKHDLLEVACFSNNPIEPFFKSLIYDDETYILLDDKNIPYIAFGCGISPTEEAYIWMLGTNDVFKYKKIFVKYCKRWVNKLASKYETVTNYVHVDNKLSIRWLKWCGAVFSPKLNILGQDFYKFYITKRKIN